MCVNSKRFERSAYADINDASQDKSDGRLYCS